MSAGPAMARVLEALDQRGCRIYTRGEGARAQCPVHGSKGLTLSIRQGDKGAMLTCFAGCTLDELTAELGLTLRDLFDGDRPPGYTPPPRRIPTPWDAVTQGPGMEHLLHRIAQHQAAEASPAYWEHRALAMDGALSRPGDYPGQRTPQARATADRVTADRAAACRRRAGLARAGAGR